MSLGSRIANVPKKKPRRHRKPTSKAAAKSHNAAVPASAATKKSRLTTVAEVAQILSLPVAAIGTAVSMVPIVRAATADQATVQDDVAGAPVYLSEIGLVIGEWKNDPYGRATLRWFTFEWTPIVANLKVGLDQEADMPEWEIFADSEWRADLPTFSPLPGWYRLGNEYDGISQWWSGTAWTSQILFDGLVGRGVRDLANPPSQELMARNIVPPAVVMIAGTLEYPEATGGLMASIEGDRASLVDLDLVIAMETSPRVQVAVDEPQGSSTGEPLSGPVSLGLVGTAQVEGAQYTHHFPVHYLFHGFDESDELARAEEWKVLGMDRPITLTIDVTRSDSQLLDGRQSYTELGSGRHPD